MEPISGMIHSPAAPADIQRASGIQAPRQEDRPRTALPAPVTDEYTPEEPPAPWGRYWPGRDEDGSPKIFFDDPESTAAPDPDEKAPPPEGPEKPASGDRAEKCVCNTDKVDREIEKLKERQEQLERQLRSEADSTKAAELERQLAQVRRELQQKDNDSYRRQHAEFS